MTRTRKSVLLTALLVVSSLTAGVSVAEVSNDGTTYQMQDDGLNEVAVDSGETFWQGQFLRFTANQTNASEVWSIHRVENGQVGELVTEVLLDSNGTAVFGTSDLDGQFAVVNENNEPVVIRDGVAQGVEGANAAAFEVTAQSLDVSFADRVARNDDSRAARTDLQIRSNRAGYSLYVLSDGLSASQIADVFPAVEVRDGRAITTRPVRGNEVFDANFTGVEAGTYNFTLVGTDNGVEATTSIQVSEPVEGSASLANRTVSEERGDVVRLDVSFDGTDRATVQVGSEEVGYLSRFVVRDADGDGQATIAVNTYEAGISADTPGITAVGEDEITNYRLETDPIPGRLDAATYPVVVSVGAQRTDVGSILLSERSTDGIQVWTAPDRTTVQSISQLTEVASQDQSIAYQDWAVVQVEASGLYGYVQNRSDLNNETTGLSMTLTRVGEINVPSRQIPLDQWRLFVDESNNQFFLVTDSNTLERNETYHANFTVSAANPYVSSGNATSLETNFTVVPRNVTFAQEPVEVPASSSATISGNSTLAAGTELTIEAANTADAPFLKRQTATVSEGGSWEATFDFSDVEAGTNFSVEVRETPANATGVVVGEGGAAEEAADGEETPADGAAEETTVAADGAAEETTAVDGAAEETTAAADGTVDEVTTAADGAAEETTAADGAAEETTAAASFAPVSALGTGSASLLAGLGVLLVGGAFASRRR